MNRRIFATLGVAGLILSGSAGTAIAGTPDGGGSTALAGQSTGTSANVTICHATRSVTHPYVRISVSRSALAAHKAHQDRRDLVPVPSRGCPPNLTFPGPAVPGVYVPCVVGPGVVQTRNSVTGTSAHDTIDCTGASPGKWILGLDGNDTITGTAFNDAIIGGEGNDTLTGGPGNDYLRGNAGNDTVTGSAGLDTLIGDSGNDTLSGGVDNDTIIARPADLGADTVNGDAGNDTCNGVTSEGDTLTGCEM